MKLQCLQSSQSNIQNACVHLAEMNSPDRCIINDLKGKRPLLDFHRWLIFPFLADPQGV